MTPDPRIPEAIWRRLLEFLDLGLRGQITIHVVTGGQAKGIDWKAMWDMRDEKLLPKG